MYYFPLASDGSTKTVAIIAAKLKEFLPLLFTLYTFGQDLLAQIVYHDDDRLHQGNGIIVSRQAVHELLIDLDDIDGRSDNPKMTR